MSEQPRRVVIFILISARLNLTELTCSKQHSLLVLGYVVRMLQMSGYVMSTDNGGLEGSSGHPSESAIAGFSYYKTGSGEVRIVQVDQYLNKIPPKNKSWSSSVSTMSIYRLDDRARSPAGAKDFSSSLCVQASF
jgi:hypothetical protein